MVQPPSPGAILRRSCEPIFVEDRELIHRGLPIVPGSPPVLCDVAQRQPDQFGGRIITGEVAARFDDLALLTPTEN